MLASDCLHERRLDAWQIDINLWDPTFSVEFQLLLSEFIFFLTSKREKRKKGTELQRKREERERIQNIIMRKNYSIHLENRPKNAKCINE